MNEAENMAHLNNCIGILQGNFDFQARNFYEKLGRIDKRGFPIGSEYDSRVLFEQQ